MPVGAVSGTERVIIMRSDGSFKTSIINTYKNSELIQKFLKYADQLDKKYLTRCDGLYLLYLTCKRISEIDGRIARYGENQAADITYKRAKQLIMQAAQRIKWLEKKGTIKCLTGDY